MATKKHTGLGRGIEAIFSNPTQDTATKTNTNKQDEKPSTEQDVVTRQSAGIEGFGELRKVRLSKIEPDPKQPRKNFDADSLQELADSIKEHGLLEPLDVQQNGERYILVNGERRWRAAKLAGLKEVPVIVSEYDEKKRAIIGLIDNIQREDLNPIEEAEAYQRLIEEYGLKQDEVAKQVSKSRTAITNFLRLLKLSEPVRNMVIAGTLTMGHARALLAVEDPEEQQRLANQIVAENLSVREVEKLIKNLGKTKKKVNKTGADDSFTALYRSYEEQISSSLGLKVDIKAKDNQAGRIELTYANQDDFEKIMDRLMNKI